MMERYLARKGPHPDMPGTQDIYRFPNGYGASVIRGLYTFGGRENLYELAVLVFKPGSFTDFKGIHKEIYGYLTEETLRELLTGIKARLTTRRGVLR